MTIERINILRRVKDRSGDAELLERTLQRMTDIDINTVTAENTGDPRDHRRSLLVRWGCTDSVPAHHKTLNAAKNITLTANKGLFRADMAMRGLGRHFPATWWDLEDVPWDLYRNTGLLLRPTKHARGKDFHVLTDNRYEQAVELRNQLGPVYVQELLRVDAEYRITFCHGRIVQVVQRDVATTGKPVPQNQNNVNNVRWNNWPINVIQKVWPVIQACPLTFGAMDVLVTRTRKMSGVDEQAYVGEINSAPEIYPYSAQCLAKAILFYLNSDVPPWDPSDWPEDTYRCYIHPALIDP